MSDSTAHHGPRRSGDRHRHLGVHAPPGSACTWCAYLDARSVWWFLALTCLPQLVARRSPSRR